MRLWTVYEVYVQSFTHCIAHMQTYKLLKEIYSWFSRLNLNFSQCKLCTFADRLIVTCIVDIYLFDEWNKIYLSKKQKGNVVSNFHRLFEFQLILMRRISQFKTYYYDAFSINKILNLWDSTISSILLKKKKMIEISNS